MKIVEVLKKLKFGRLYRRSAGNIWYPFILISWWLARLLVPRRIIKIDGLDFTLSCTNWITHFRWYLFKSKEPETIYFLNNNLKEGDIFFDIGANIGVFSIYAAKRFKDLKVYSFEPEVSNLAILKENIIENKITDKVIIYGVGIGEFNGLSKLHLQDLTAGSALHTENKKTIKLSAEGRKPIVWAEGIYTVSLDCFCKDINVVPNVIKIDTDGNEHKILMGATNLLKNPMLRAIIIEMPENQIECCHSILLESGFNKKEYSSPKTRNEIWIKRL